jgi:hypothetical protein
MSNFVKEDVMHQLIGNAYASAHNIDRILCNLNITGNASEIKDLFNIINGFCDCTRAYIDNPERYCIKKLNELNCGGG